MNENGPGRLPWAVARVRKFHGMRKGAAFAAPLFCMDPAQKMATTAPL